MNRRSFLGLLGGAVVIAATPEFFTQGFGDLVAPAQPTDGIARLFDLTIFNDADEPALFSVSRANSPDALLRFGVARGGIFRWYATPESEIALPQGIASLMIDAPPFIHWSAAWRDEHNHIWVSDERGTCQGLETPA
jgi:hypothetical protein